MSPISSKQFKSIKLNPIKSNLTLAHSVRMLYRNFNDLKWKAKKEVSLKSEESCGLWDSGREVGVRATAEAKPNKPPPYLKIEYQEPGWTGQCSFGFPLCLVFIKHSSPSHASFATFPIFPHSPHTQDR